ncbi:MAG: hypothetical protein HUJ55_00120, partial [Ileibacterium sp.]|nr:hypothetical protein [Ileibacterium sp.]
FIDGVLVADLGGIHQRGGVEIDFSTGKITYYYRYDQNSQGTHYRDWDTTIKAMFTSAGAAGTEVWKGDTFANNTQHTLQMFYLERGGSASNLDVKFNLHTPQPSKLHKSDQYGNPVAGATFEVKDSDGMSFSPKYEATTDANGEFTFYRTGTKTPMSLTDMEKTFGTEFILEETGVPDGYRPVSQQVHLKIEGGMLTCTKPYEEGAWAQTIVKASAPKKLYDKSGNQVYGSGSGVSSGTLFIMPVLRDNGKDTSNQFNDWTPVIGTESLGFEEFEVAKDEDNINQVIAAYKKTVQNSGKYPSYAFKNLASGGTITFEALPGEALEYYDYRVLLNNYRQYDPQNADYKLEFFFTTATSLGGMNANNTYHIDPDSHAAEGRPGFIDIEWAARVEVPDIINVLLFQKTDSVGNIVTDHTAFALYPSDQLLNGDIAYIADGDIPIVLNDISSGDNQGTVKSVNGEAADPADNWHYVVSNDFTLSDQSLAESGGLIREEGAGNILVYKGDVVRYIIKPAQNAYVNPNTGDSDPRSLVGATHGFDSQYPCPELGVGGRGHFAWLKSAKDGSNEYYILREIKAPSGYKIEANETLVVVNDTGVYANAGTAEDNITVYNDPGYLVDPLHKFATNDSIDSTLTWITNDLQVADGTDYLSFSSLASSNKYGTGNSTSTKSHPIAVGSETVSGSPVKVDGLLRNYMTYKEGTISSDSLQGSLGAPLFDGLFSYILNTDRTKPVNKTVDSSVLGVEEGWSALKIYQDTDYGLVNKGTCDYTNLEDKDLSHLYSGGTLVEIKDKVTAKVTLVKTDDKVTNPTKLAGAEFVLLVKKNNTEYYYNNATGKFDTTSIDDAKVFVTVNETGTTGGVEGKDGYFVLPTLVEGTYYLRETNPPTGYRKFTNDIEVKVSVDHSLGPDESPVQKQPMSRGESKPDVKVNKGAADEDATELTKETTGADQPYYVPDGQAGYADFQFKFEVQNSRNGVDVEVNKKKDDSGTKTSLAGAYFVLYRNVPTEEGSTTTKVQYYHKNDNYE